MLEAFGALNQPSANFHIPSENLFLFCTIKCPVTTVMS